jgi:hypothetical protein
MVQMRELGRWVTATFRAKRADGTTVTIEEVTIKVQDPASTGTIWNAPPTSYTILRLADGSGEVDDMEDGTFWVVNTGERLTRIS